MKPSGVSIAAVLVLLGCALVSWAADMREKGAVEVESVGLHPGMDPGMYVCASGHLHIKGAVKNNSAVTLGRIKVTGRAFGPDGKLLGEATASTKQPSLGPGEKAPVDLEFLTVGGPLIQAVKRHEVTVIEALAK
jgi:hypothetical protein